MVKFRFHNKRSKDELDLSYDNEYADYIDNGMKKPISLDALKRGRKFFGSSVIITDVFPRSGNGKHFIVVIVRKALTK